METESLATYLCIFSIDHAVEQASVQERHQCMVREMRRTRELRRVLGVPLLLEANGGLLIAWNIGKTLYLATHSISISPSPISS